MNISRFFRDDDDDDDDDPAVQTTKIAWYYNSRENKTKFWRYSNTERKLYNDVVMSVNTTESSILYIELYAIQTYLNILTHVHVLWTENTLIKEGRYLYYFSCKIFLHVVWNQ